MCIRLELLITLFWCIVHVHTLFWCISLLTGKSEIGIHFVPLDNTELPREEQPRFDHYVFQYT